jgi:hypothetical protein
MVESFTWGEGKVGMRERERERGVCGGGDP